MVTLRAGTPLREVEALLAQRNQMLAFEPPDLGPLLGREAGQGTLVGAVMGNLAGSRRLSAGAARDHLLGFSGVNGRGEAFKSGGKVMKNVTGYDLSKLLAGSWGTLAVLDEVFGESPARARPDTHASAARPCGRRGREGDVRRLGSPHDVSGAAHVGDRTALRIEGVAPSVEARLKGLRDLLSGVGRKMEELGTLESRAFWREVRDVAPLKAADDAVVWKISCPPTEGPASSPHQGKTSRRRGLLRLVGRPDLARLAAERRRRPRNRARRPGPARAATRRSFERRRPFVAAVPVFQPQPPPLAALATREGELRSQAPLQSGADGVPVMGPRRSSPAAAGRQATVGAGWQYHSRQREALGPDCAAARRALGSGSG